MTPLEPRALTILLLDRCNNCGSSDLPTWSASVDPAALHMTQVKCRGCGLVFSNPQCDAETIRAYYEKAYYETHWSHLLTLDESALKEMRSSFAGEVERIQSMTHGDRLLEIGAGTGAFLSAARSAGFEAFGVELSASAVEQAIVSHSLENVVQGTIDDVSWTEGSFDVLYTWHVIEHVTDLDHFIRRIHAFLRDGGLCWVGTENYRNASHYASRLWHLLLNQPPPFATSSEHTYVFTARTLRDALERRGFEIILVETYQPSWHAKMAGMRFRSIFSKAFFASLHLLNLVFRTGPLMRVAARRK